MVTVQQMFDAAIDLMDEQDESTGSTHTTDTREYELRTISILNIAINALFPFSSNYDSTAQERPVIPELLNDDRKKPDFSQVIFLDDGLCWALLPFFLASLLRSSEDTEFSMRMMTEYNGALANLKGKVTAKFEKIDTPYGLF